MEKMLVVIFDDEKKAYEGSSALLQLDGEGSLTIHSEAVISKGADGKLTVKQTDGDFPIRTLGGTALGSLIGILGGPVGFAVGATAGAFAGLVSDLHVAGVDATFLDDVSKALKPGKYALVADVSEEWVTPADTRMEALGGVVHRAVRSSVANEQLTREEAAMRAELASMKAEHEKAQADRKKRLQSKIEQLDAKLQAKLQQNKQRREELQRELDVKVHAVQQRASQAGGDAKKALEARADELAREYEIGKPKQTPPGVTRQ